MDTQTLVILLLVVVTLLAVAVIWLAYSVRKFAPDASVGGGEIRQRELIGEVREELAKNTSRIDQVFRSQAALDREEMQTSSKRFREELVSSLGHFSQTISSQLSNIANIQNTQIDKFSSQLAQLITSNEQRLETLRRTLDSRITELVTGNATSLDVQRKAIDEKLQLAITQARENRDESAASLIRFGSTIAVQLNQVGSLLKEHLETLRATLDSRITELVTGNAASLEVQRKAVDEKLQLAITQARENREESAASLVRFGSTITDQLNQVGSLLKGQLETLRTTLDNRITELVTGNAASLEVQRKAVDEKLQLAITQARENRDESASSLFRFGATITDQLNQVGILLTGQLDSLRQQLEQQLLSLTAANDKKLVEMRETVEAKLTQLQADNSQKLEQMRQTVDEKLHNTLEQRLGESFKLVSERLELVHKGLGEMQSIASGVGDLKRVLTNIKTRGNWGEIQLENLLEQILTPDQYEKNVATKKDSNDRVEFAIKLPGRESGGDVVWLPIDAKFPREDYERLVDAQDQGNIAQVEESSKALESRIKNEAKAIRDKYIDPPNTTDFALLFLATEGLYAELIRRPGLQDTLQREYRVLLVGPSNLSALLNSLQMGFRSLAIEKRSSEVWSLLGAVKTEFGKFGDVLEKTRNKLEQASKSIGEAETRTRQIHRKLRSVEDLPSPQVAAQLLGDLGENEEDVPSGLGTPEVADSDPSANL